MRKLALVMGALAVGIMGWRALRGNGADPKLVYDRFWVDHLPRDWNDEFQSVMIHGDRPRGQFGNQTPWKGRWEGFHYHVLPRSEGELELIFPPGDHSERVTFRARACAERGFDYCLEVSGSSRGGRHYYSKRDWQVHGDLATAREQILAAEGLLPHDHEPAGE